MEKRKEEEEEKKSETKTEPFSLATVNKLGGKSPNLWGKNTITTNKHTKTKKSK